MTAAGLTAQEWDLVTRLREDLPKIERALARTDDPETLRLILSGRVAIKAGGPGIPLEDLWKGQSGK